MTFTPAAINTAAPRMTGGWHPHAMRLPDGSVRPTCLTTANVGVYFQLSPRAAAWQALTAQEQQVAVDQACRWLNTLCWDTNIDCCDRSFADAWEMAFSELALWLHQNPTAIISGTGGAQQGTYTSKQKLGDLEVEFSAFPVAAGVTTEQRVSPKAPLILQKAPWLVDILSCWLQTNWKGTRRFIPVDRN